MQTYEKNFPKQMFRKVFKQFLFIHTIAVARVLPQKNHTPKRPLITPRLK